MAVPVLKLNLVPEPSLWRARHLALGWSALALGVAVFLGTIGYTAWSYHRADQAGKAAIYADAQTHLAAQDEQRILGQLQQIDVDQELPRWRLAERILSERAAPWSRLAAEMENCLVDGSRVKNMERTRGHDQDLLVKVKGEARSHDAEVGFIDDLRQDAVFTQVQLDREAQEPGGGWEFDLSLPVAAIPPPFEAKHEGPEATRTAPIKSAPRAQKPVAAPAPQPAPPEAPAPPPPVMNTPQPPRIPPSAREFPSTRPLPGDAMRPMRGGVPRSRGGAR